jgi:hypothetical protein
VRVGEARGPGPLVDRHPEAVDLLAQGRMRSHVACDLAPATPKQSVIPSRASRRMM